jgi:hypothetical protein
VSECPSARLSSSVRLSQASHPTPIRFLFSLVLPALQSRRVRDGKHLGGQTTLDVTTCETTHPLLYLFLLVPSPSHTSPDLPSQPFPQTTLGTVVPSLPFWIQLRYCQLPHTSHPTLACPPALTPPPPNAHAHVHARGWVLSPRLHRRTSRTHTITNALLCVPSPWPDPNPEPGLGLFCLQSTTYFSSALLASPPAAKSCFGTIVTGFVTGRQTNPFFQAHLAYAVSDCAGPPETESSCDGRCDLEESLLPYPAAPAASSSRRGTFLTASPPARLANSSNTAAPGPRQRRREREREREGEGPPHPVYHDDLRRSTTPSRQ